jgi:tRNA(His) guanylyltransferase
MQWSTFFPNQPLTRPYPTFDGRCVAYPETEILRDYLAWRQADCHINNLYNTTFWSLVLKGEMEAREAEEKLKGTVAADKNEILFSKFGINYNNEPEMYRKGTIMYRAYDDVADKVGDEGGGKAADVESNTQIEKERKRKMKARIAVEHVDVIGDGFWDSKPYILAPKRRAIR